MRNSDYLELLGKEYPVFKALLEEKLADVLQKEEKAVVSKGINGEDVTDVKIDCEKKLLTIYFSVNEDGESKEEHLSYLMNDFTVKKLDKNLTIAFNSLMAEIFKEEYIQDSIDYFCEERMDLYCKLQNPSNTQTLSGEMVDDKNQTQEEFDFVCDVLETLEEKVYKHVLDSINYSVYDFEEGQTIRDYDIPDDKDYSEKA